MSTIMGSTFILPHYRSTLDNHKLAHICSEIYFCALRIILHESSTDCWEGKSSALKMWKQKFIHPVVFFKRELKGNCNTPQFFRFIFNLATRASVTISTGHMFCNWHGKNLNKSRIHLGQNLFLHKKISLENSSMKEVLCYVFLCHSTAVVEVSKNQSISLFTCKVLSIMTTKYVKCKSIFNLHIHIVKPQQVRF